MYTQWIILGLASLFPFGSLISTSAFSFYLFSRIIIFFFYLLEINPTVSSSLDHNSFFSREPGWLSLSVLFPRNTRLWSENLPSQLSSWDYMWDTCVLQSIIHR